MSDAIAPPTVTKRVPGVTGTNQPRGMSQRMSWSRLVPAPAVTIPRSRSTDLIPARAVASSTIPPAFRAASPYERPRPRAIAPRAGLVRSRRSTSPSSSGVTSRARLGEAPLHPASRGSAPGSSVCVGDIQADPDENDPEEAHDLERAVPQHEVLRRAALTALDEEGVAEDGEHERHDRELVPGDAGDVGALLERPQAVADHGDA